MVILAFIILLPIVVTVHELGHYFAARKYGVRVKTFSFGFGKKIWGRKDKNGTEWRISMIPLGGYCELFGQSDLPENAKKRAEAVKNLTAKDKKEHFEFKPRWQRAIIIVAGPAFNYILGFALFLGLFWFAGVRDNSIRVQCLAKDMPALAAGLSSGDALISINNTEIKRGTDLAKLVESAKTYPIRIKYSHGAEVKETLITPKLQDGKMRLGLNYGVMKGFYNKVGFIGGIQKSAREIYDISTKSLSGLGQIIVGKRSSSELGGLITIAKASGSALSDGAYSFIYLIAFISISLGLLNLLPIPVLDGGYLFIYLIEAARRKDLSEKTKDIMFKIGFALIILLMLISNGNDIMRLFK